MGVKLYIEYIKLNIFELKNYYWILITTYMYSNEIFFLILQIVQGENIILIVIHTFYPLH